MKGFREVERGYVAVYEVVGSEIPITTYKTLEFQATTIEQARKKAKRGCKEVKNMGYIESVKLFRLVDESIRHRDIPIR